MTDDFFCAFRCRLGPECEFKAANSVNNLTWLTYLYQVTRRYEPALNPGPALNNISALIVAISTRTVNPPASLS